MEKSAEFTPEERIAAALATLDEFDEPTLQAAIERIDMEIVAKDAEVLDPLRKRRRALMKCLQGKRMKKFRRKSKGTSNGDATEDDEEGPQLDDAVLAALIHGPMALGAICKQCACTPDEVKASLGRLEYARRVARHANDGTWFLA